MVESQCAEEQLTKTQEYFCTNGTFQCSDCFDIETFLWRMAGRNTAQSNLNPRAGSGSNSLAPQWLQSGSVLEAPEHFWRVFCKGMRNYTDLFYSGTNPTSTCNYTFQKIDWVLLCQFPIQSSHIRVFSPFFPLPESHF